jgi:hypothetical protein
MWNNWMFIAMHSVVDIKKLKILVISLESVGDL